MSTILNFENWSKLNEESTMAPMLTPQQIVDKIVVGMENGNMFGAGTDESSIYKVIVGKINKINYPQVLAIVNKKGFKTICAWLATDMTKPGANSFRAGGQDEKIIGGIERHLNQFNPSEDWPISGTGMASGI